MTELSSPLQYSINDAFYNLLDIEGEEIYDDFVSTLEERYNKLASTIEVNHVCDLSIQLIKYSK